MNIQNQYLQQQIQMLNRNQQQQQIQQQLQQQAPNHQIQQQINALLAQQQQQQQQEQQRQQQQQNVQNAQIAAAATAAAAGTVPNISERKVPHTELVNASGQSIAGLVGAPGFQVTSSVAQQQATTPIPPAATPNSAQQIQKHFDGAQTLLLQQALLQHANSSECSVVD